MAKTRRFWPLSRYPELQSVVKITACSLATHAAAFLPASPAHHRVSRWPILAFTWPISVFTIGRFPNRRAASSASVSVSPRDTEEAEATPRRESVDEHSRGVLFMSAAQLLLDQGAGISALSSARSSPS